MAHVITGLCMDTKDQSCVDVCPVDCIHPADGIDGRDAYDAAPQLYVDPETCIDCGACVPACPVGAIMMAEELTVEDQKYIEINANFFARRA